MNDKNIVSKQYLQKFYDGEEGVYHNVPGIFVSSENLEFLKEKHKLEVLNTNGIHENTVNILTGFKLPEIMAERQKKALLPHEKMGKYISGGLKALTFLAFIGLIVVIAIGLYTTKKMDQEKAMNEQLLAAQKLATNTKHEWHTMSSYKVPGPLNIDLVAWNNTLLTRAKADSLQIVINGLPSKRDAEIQTLQQNHLLAEKESQRVVDSIKAANIQVCNAVIATAKNNAQTLVDAGNPDDEEAYIVTINKANDIIAKANDQVNVLKGDLNKQIQAVQSNLKQLSVYNNQNIARVKSTTDQQINLLKKSIPRVTTYQYDLKNVDQYMSKMWSTITYVLALITLLLLAVFLGSVISIIVKACKGLAEKTPKPQHYSSDTLRSFIKTGQSDQIGVTFFNLPQATLQKCQQLLSKYDVHILCTLKSFELNGTFSDEKLPINEQNHTEPLCYITVKGGKKFLIGGWNEEISQNTNHQTHQTEAKRVL